MRKRNYPYLYLPFSFFWWHHQKDQSTQLHIWHQCNNPNREPNSNRTKPLNKIIERFKIFIKNYNNLRNSSRKVGEIFTFSRHPKILQYLKSNFISSTPAFALSFFVKFSSANSLSMSSGPPNKKINTMTYLVSTKV